MAVNEVHDPYQHKARYIKWKDGGQEIEGITREDAQLITEYMDDMATGKYVGGRKGSRSPIRLNTIKSRMTVLTKLMRDNLGKGLLDVTQEDLHDLFSRMREGEIKKIWGRGKYQSVADYVVSYKAFWHWRQRKTRIREGKDLPDITMDLDTSKHKPTFTYLTQEQVRQLAEAAKEDYRMMMWFMYDSGIRSPTELMNVRVNDLEWKEGLYQLQIREETSKTFGRRIKLMLCSDRLRAYITRHKLQPSAFLFRKAPRIANQYLKRLGERILGPKYAGLTMYDFRHSSACYWLPRYKSESALKYRFGWKNTEMIHYYTEYLGMKDTITSEDLVDTEERSNLEKELEEQKRRAAIMQDQLAAMGKQVELLVDAKLREILKKHNLRAK